LALSVIALALAGITGPAARAYDVQLDAETMFRAYEARSPSTATTWTRRRFVQNLQLSVTQALADEPNDQVLPRLRTVVQLRLSQDVGDTCFVGRDRCFDPSDANAATTFQALATDGLLDAMLAYVDVTGLPLGVEARAGRQLWIDPVGFARVDGLTARIAPAEWISLSAVGGQQVRGTSVAGSSAFEPPGVIRLDLPPREATLASYASPPTDTWLLGAALELGDESIVRAQASVRDVSDDDGLVMRRVGLSMRSSPIDTLHLSTLAVLDAADPALVLGHAGAHWQLNDVALRASADLMRPRFDLGSIWAYFPTATVEQGELGASVKISESSEIGGGLRGRRTEMRTASDHDAGLHAFVATSVQRFQVSSDGYVWLGDLGDLWGADARVARALSDWVQTEMGVSVQRVNDPARIAFDGVSVSEWARAAWRFTAQTQASLELAHAYNRVVTHRFTALASLQIGAWR
jgi:hypothetical protein